MTPALKPWEVLALGALMEKTLYTAENISQWVEAEADLNKEPYEATIRTYDRAGNAHEIPAKGPGKTIVYCSYNQTVQEEDLQPASDTAFKNMLVRVADAEPATQPEKCCRQPEMQTDYAKYTEEWKKSPFYFNLMAKFTSKARFMTKVESIACFGLGELRENTGSHTDHVIANYLQHIVALEIRACLAVKQKMDVSDIPIYAQDPKYCANCKDVLEAFGFKIMESNSGFLKVDGNTFVITSAPTVPVRQIVGDITRNVGGPAGILCQPIDSEGIETSEGIIDMLSSNIYLHYAMGATSSGMAAVWRDEPIDSSDEESDLTNTVHYSEEHPVMKASIFPDFAIYLKKEKKKEKV